MRAQNQTKTRAESRNRLNFTKKALEDLPVPASGRQTYHDTKTKYLTLRVTAGGSKTFYYYRKYQGKVRRIKMSTFPEMTVHQARTKAAEYSGEYAVGRDPAQDRGIDRKGLSFAELFQSYMENHAKPHKKTWREDQRKYDTILSSWGPLLATEITVARVMKLRTKIGSPDRENKPYLANRILALLRKVFNYGISSLRLNMENPCNGIPKFKETPRRRYLQPHELKPLFDAIDSLADGHRVSSVGSTMRDFFKVDLFTGQRRGNVQAMRWEDIDFESAIWTIPAPEVKNDEEMRVALSPEVMEILRRHRDEIGDESPYVFPARNRTGREGHITEPRRAWLRVLKKAGLEGLRIHDLRRTLGSWQAGQGSSLAIVGRSLGHKDIRVTHRVYAHVDLEPVRESVEAATKAMMAAVNGKAKKGK